MKIEQKGILNKQGNVYHAFIIEAGLLQWGRGLIILFSLLFFICLIFFGTKKKEVYVLEPLRKVLQNLSESLFTQF